LLNGSALAVNWENENIPAIVEAWYPGQAAGLAIADVLFGDYNPGGRLPVTFYKTVKDLPAFDDYKISNQTYRYFKGVPLYPFGYGLSYTTFQYTNMEIRPEVKNGDSVSVSAIVKNTGKIAGDEVVQVYVSSLTKGDRVPVRSLQLFKRIHLQPGEEKKVELTLPSKAFLVNGETVTGKFEVSIGGGQPDVKVETTSNVLKTTVTIL